MLIMILFLFYLMRECTASAVRQHRANLVHGLDPDEITAKINEFLAAK